MNLMLILFHPFSIEGREPCLRNYFPLGFNIGLYSDKSVAVRWLRTFANILFFEHQNDIFNAILRITK